MFLPEITILFGYEKSYQIINRDVSGLSIVLSIILMKTYKMIGQGLKAASSQTAYNRHLKKDKTNC